MQKLIFLAESSDEIIAEVDITDEEMQKLRQDAEEEGVTLEVYILSLLEETVCGKEAIKADLGVREGRCFKDFS